MKLEEIGLNVYNVKPEAGLCMSSFITPLDQFVLP